MPNLYDLHSTPFNPENPSLDYNATTQLITAVGNTLTPAGGFLKFSADGNYTLNSTPSVETDGFKAGDIVTIMNYAANTVTLSRGAGGPGGTALKLGAATRALGPGGSITLMFDGAVWVELTFVTGTATA